MFHPARSNKFALAAALAALLPTGFADAATTAANVAVPELSEHAPGAAAVRRLNADELRLFAVTRQGLSERHFQKVAGQPDKGWFAWRHDGRPPGMPVDPKEWRRFLPASSGLASQSPDVFTFFDFPQTPPGGEIIGIGHLKPRNQINAIDFSWQTENPPGPVFPELFNPQTVAWGSTGEMDVFGTNSEDGRPGSTTSLLSLHGILSPMSTWGFTSQNIGRPSILGMSRSVSLGPQSAATAVLGQSMGPAVSRHMIFAKANLGSEEHVTFAIGDLVGGRFSWGIDLGTPRLGAMLVDSPLVVSYSWKDCETCANVKRITVWATTFDRTADRYTLWERHFDARDTAPSDPNQIAQWSPWQTFGSPPGLDSRTKFRLTAGLVWYQGFTLRINMFGYTDGDASGPERIVEFYWSQYGWNWGSPALRTPPSGAGVRTMSATVLQSPQSNPTYTRLSVFGRTGGVSNPGATDVGHIWELYDVIENGADSGWRWGDLSFECAPGPPLCSIPPDSR